MPETRSAIPSPRVAASRFAGRAAELKWLAVFAALLLATILDGMAASELSSVKEAGSVREQAAITLPSDRCEPGCAIMMASNQSGDRL